MNWYFLRHGQINSNLNKVYSGRSDEPLNARGLQQAAQAVDLIKSKAIDRVISSPLASGGSDGDCLGVSERLKVAFDPAFNEMIFGPWEGISESECSTAIPLWSGRCGIPRLTT